MSSELQYRSAKKICELFNEIYSGYSGRELFRDWLSIVEHTLDQTPNHLHSLIETGKMATDPEDVQKEWARLNSRYKNRDWQIFGEAFQILLETASEGYCDTVGQVFMDYANPGGHNGQYFTPWNIAECMARMMIIDTGDEIQDRLRKAKDRLMQEGDELEKSLLTAITLAGLVVPEDEKTAYFCSRVYPLLARYFDPILVCDPACGSGVMLLAAASLLPPEAVAFGLVQFYGMDIDATCVQMARINCKLYGLNGSHLSWVYEMTREQLETVPSPYQEIYLEAIDHQDEPEVIEALVQEIYQAKQLSFFA